VDLIHQIIDLIAARRHGGVEIDGDIRLRWLRGGNCCKDPPTPAVPTLDTGRRRRRAGGRSVRWIVTASHGRRINRDDKRILLPRG
jgi:hypothetical protein